MFRQLENLMIPVVPCFIIRTLKVKSSFLLLCLQESFLETCSAYENTLRTLLFHLDKKKSSPQRRALWMRIPREIFFFIQTERNCPYLVEDDGEAPGWI